MSIPASPWREPMVWLVFGLPAVSVVAGIALLFVLAGSGAADPVGDDVRRTSQIQQTDLSPDIAAQRLGLSMHLRVGEDSIELRPVGHIPPETALQLTLAHPAQAAQDLTLQLLPDGGLWRAQAQLDTSHDWNLQLVPVDGGWRLSGRLPRGELSAMLMPALRAP